MPALQSWIARAIVRVAITVAPADLADKLEKVTRPIWRPEAQQ